MKKKIIALILATVMTTSVCSSCSLFNKDNDSSSRRKSSRDKDDDEDDEPDNSIDVDSLSYEEGYLPFYEEAEVSTDSIKKQIANKDEKFSLDRSEDEIYYFLDGETFVGSDSSEYVFDNGEIKWYKSSDHSDNYHLGAYTSYHGCDAGIYMIANQYATAQSYTDYYDRNADDDFYIPKNLVVIEFHLVEKTVGGEASDEDVTIVFYGYDNGETYDLWGFVDEVANGNYYSWTKK